ncbi:MAG: acyl-CoA/acyl-ACP dehydrogenase [Gammaproteobacteria bacterium]|nr:acyl-CoA/acyl-ACP dehydrogenase [Gammaproteobacteria bacterium]
MTTEVRELHDSARQVLGGIDLAADEQATWPLIADLGWLMISTPEDMGGLGMGLAGACALHMELGRRLATIPFLPATLAIEAICLGDLPGREAWLERLTAGSDYVAAPLAESALHLLPGDKELAGTAVAVQSADRASHVMVWTSSGDCVALVALDRPGVKIHARPTWDTTRRLFEVEFAGAVLDDALVLARGPAAQALARRLATVRDFALAAEAAGGAAALLDLTVEYLQTRQQFGRPLALFQALKHRCADLKALTEGAQALLQDSLAKLGDYPGGIAQAELAGRAAKQLACSAYASVTEESLQLHGGIGMTSEHVCHLFLKRAMLNEHLGRSQESCSSDLAKAFLECS